MGDENVQRGIDLLSLASKEDFQKNYRRAKSLYELGIEVLQEEIKGGCVGDLSIKAISQKCNMYKERINEIKKYLDTHPNYERRASVKRQHKVDYSDVENSPRYFCEQAIVEASTGIEMDRKKKYFEAISHYEKAVELFLDAIKYEVKGELAKDGLKAQCLHYLNRCRELMDIMRNPSENAIPEASE